MAEGIRRQPGGIEGLLEFLDDPKTARAVEGDLIRAGWRLRDVGREDFTWRDLSVFVSEAPPDSAIFRALEPNWMWTHEAHLLAANADWLALLVWQNTEDGQAGRNQPKPIKRPGIHDDTEKTVKGNALPLDQMKAKMDAFRERGKTNG